VCEQNRAEKRDEAVAWGKEAVHPTMVARDEELRESSARSWPETEDPGAVGLEQVGGPEGARSRRIKIHNRLVYGAFAQGARSAHTPHVDLYESWLIRRSSLHAGGDPQLNWRLVRRRAPHN
jgi:hypothetical protein